MGAKPMRNLSQKVGGGERFHFLIISDSQKSLQMITYESNDRDSGRRPPLKTPS